jgi:hypothetical protein
MRPEIRLTARPSLSRLLTFTLYPLVGLFAMLTLLFLYDIERGLTNISPYEARRASRQHFRPSSSSSSSNAAPESIDRNTPWVTDDLTVYKGKPWITDLTASRTVLYQTAFASCEVHDVWTEDHSAIQKDWLWAEEIDHVNVIVVDEAGDFYFFKQKVRRDGEAGVNLRCLYVFTFL